MTTNDVTSREGRSLFPEHAARPPASAPRDGGRAVSPAMRQYWEMKREAGDALLFFRMGDFYEMFYEDALTAARVLDIAVTSRQKDQARVPIPMAGVPHHAAEGYLGRLVRAGHRVAVCEQVEPAGKSRGPVRRRITRVLTPSTYLDPEDLEGAEGAYLMAACEGGAKGRPALGAAFVDLSTGDFRAAEFHGEDRLRECIEVMAAFRPRELLSPEDAAALPPPAEGEEGPLRTDRPGFWFEYQHARDALLRHFGTASLDAFGIEDAPAATCAAGAALTYLTETQRARLTHIAGLSRISRSGRLVMDPLTQRNLELFAPLSAAPGSAAQKATLAVSLDATATGMGARLLRRRLAQPLLDPDAIRARLEAVAEWVSSEWGEDAAQSLPGCPDLERLASRAALRLAGPREYLKIAAAVQAAEQLREALGPARGALLADLRSRLEGVRAVADRITDTISEEAPATGRESGREPGRLIREGVSAELDDLRGLHSRGHSAIRDLEARERARSGIASLRIRHNQVFGYTIEIGKGRAARVPDDYVRRQTLVNAERYVTEELKALEQRLTGAEERITAIESEIFGGVVEEVAAAAGDLLRVAAAVAAADVTAAFAATASRRDYVQPEIHDGFDVEVSAGRHPVVEALLPDGFVPNDLRLDEQGFLMILTGPNMGGKSTFLRQTALHQIMAQAGCFVPAGSARLPLVDRIFARVGASDDLARGRSTFLTEMEETAHILHHATSQSLVLLDEVGRGTATYDGLSLAWAIVEHIARDPKLRMKTLFATHYHELVTVAEAEPGVVNFHVAAREHGDEIVFLRRVAPGGARRSYGLQVARLAGIPAPVVARAKELLDRFAPEAFGDDAAVEEALASGPRASRAAREAPSNAVLERLRVTDPDSLTPREALDLLYHLRRDLDP